MTSRAWWTVFDDIIPPGQAPELERSPGWPSWQKRKGISKGFGEAIVQQALFNLG